MSFSFRDKPRLSDRIRGKSGDELFNELKEKFDQDRKMFFETAPKWGPGPTSSSFPRTGFPFDDDMMPRGRQDIRSHLDDLAARHPEFADHLRCPPWGGEVSSSQNRGRQRNESDCDDDTRSQASGVSSSSSEHQGPEMGDEPGPLRGRAQGPLPQYGLRNTVDLGQKHEADQEEIQGRGQRSMSAPPDNRSQQAEQPQRFVSRVEIPVNPVGITSGASVDGQGKPPVAPKQQQTTQQNHSTPTKTPGNVRHIPIFVEGRDEPILPKNLSQDYVEHTFPPRTVQPEVEQIFSSRQPSQPPHSFARPSQFYPQQTFTQQPTPASPKQQHHAKPQPTVPQKSEHSVPIKVQHSTSSHSPKAPSKSSSKPGEHTVPIKVQHINSSSQQPAKPPSKPPESVANDPISRVKVVQKDVEKLRAQVDQFNGISRKDKEYIYLDEMLTRNLLKLDDIETEGKENVRQARREAIRTIQECISILEAKVPVPEEVPASNRQEPMEEASAEQVGETLCQESSQSKNHDSSNGEMEVTSNENLRATQEHQASLDGSDEVNNALENNKIEVKTSQTDSEANKQNSKDIPMEEINQMVEKALQEEEMPIEGVKGDGENKGTVMEGTSGIGIPMECAVDKGTSVESVEEKRVPLEGEEDKGTTIKSTEEKAIPMEVEPAVSGKQGKESSSSIPEQVQNASSQSCDKDGKCS